MTPANELTDSVLKGLAVDDAEVSRRERAERAEDAGSVRDRLPDYLRTAVPEDLFSRIQFEDLRSFAKTWNPSMGSALLIGPTKAGKTAAAGYLFRRLLGRGVGAGGQAWQLAKRLQWSNAVDLDRARHEHPIGKGEAPEITDATHASVLVIDDIGWDRTPDAVTTVLDARYKLGRPTICTTSRTLAELGARYGGAVTRRLLESGGIDGIQVVCGDRGTP